MQWAGVKAPQGVRGRCVGEGQGHGQRQAGKGNRWGRISWHRNSKNNRQWGEGEEGGKEGACGGIRLGWQKGRLARAGQAGHATRAGRQGMGQGEQPESQIHHPHNEG